ncbi:MAG TPA: hypothetical protein VLD36_04555 [Burkholderiales bacterium]|nr:hypothetical protein [Burkholderiales bacterium]
MPLDTAKILPLLLEQPFFLPTIKGWNRLEGRPRVPEFSRSLRAEVRDPLWLLTRQWQFGELDGEDAGSPVEARLLTRRERIDRFRLREGPVRSYDGSVPLETIVEREPVAFDLVTHRQITQAFARLTAGLADQAAIRAAYRDRFALAAGAIDGYAADDASRSMLPLALAHLLDGRQLLEAIGSGAHDGWVDTLTTLPAVTREALKAAGRALVDWFAALYAVPAAGASEAWNPSRLEYDFACATRESVLVADAYRDGRLDWFDFDLDHREGAGLDIGNGETPPPIEEVLSFLPAPVSFSGMPAPRYWEMEDRKVSFADIDAHTTDIATLLLTEFALAFGNDWCVVPQEVEIGSLTTIGGLIVTDTFGERLLIRAAGRGRDEDWQRWSLFALTTRAAVDVVEPQLWLPPAVGAMLEAAPVERVAWLRDEMANLVWAVESTIPAASGIGVDGYATARASAPPPETPLPLPEGVKVRYVLGTDVPYNWRPFIPVHLPGSTRAVRLQRAQLPGGGPDPTTGRPIRGRVLAVPAPYYVFEEEVPRAGRHVTRGFQRARWQGAAIQLWVGRRTTTGRGQGASGLAFDQVEGALPGRGG